MFFFAFINPIISQVNCKEDALLFTRLCFLFFCRYNRADIEAVAQLATQKSGLEHVAGWELQTTNRLAEGGQVASVGAERYEGGRHGAALAVQQVGRVGAHFSGGRVWGRACDII